MDATADITGHPHGAADLCQTAAELYAKALHTGGLLRSEGEAAPCLIELALLHPDPDDSAWLRPVTPSAVLARLLNPIEREIQERRRLSVQLTEVFEPFMSIGFQGQPGDHGITVLEGIARINSALDLAIARCNKELLTVQPGGVRTSVALAQALPRVKSLTDRGVHMRYLYQHTARYGAGLQGFLDQLPEAQVEIRTLEQLIARTLIFDRTTAIIPAQDDHQVALELTQPAVVHYLANMFDQFWEHATPLTRHVVYTPPSQSVSAVQRSIARLLVEGHVDEAIARRLGMNVRTCRGHIAKLSTALGSGSRAQLGYLIARSGILESEAPALTV